MLSQRRDLLEQSLDFYEPDVLPSTQPTVSKHYRKTQWFGRLLFYRHGISTACPTNSVKALKETNQNQEVQKISIQTVSRKKSFKVCYFTFIFRRWWWCNVQERVCRFCASSNCSVNISSSRLWSVSRHHCLSAGTDGSCECKRWWAGHKQVVPQCANRCSALSRIRLL